MTPRLVIYGLYRIAQPDLPKDETPDTIAQPALLAVHKRVHRDDTLHCYAAALNYKLYSCHRSGKSDLSSAHLRLVPSCPPLSLLGL